MYDEAIVLAFQHHDLVGSRGYLWLATILVVSAQSLGRQSVPHTGCIARVDVDENHLTGCSFTLEELCKFLDGKNNFYRAQIN